MTMTYTCPDGHSSVDADYCSECGKKIAAAPGAAVIAPPAAAPAAPAGAAGERCPDCGTPRASEGATFCEVCRYNFVTKTPWSAGAPPAGPPPSPVPAAAATADVAAVAPTPAPTPDGQRPTPDPAKRWEVVVAVDPSLYAEPNPAMPCPAGEPERTFPLDFAENLIGRRSERRAIFPEIDLSNDPGVSSRHAILYREADGSVSLLDVGSTNGTQLNGRDVAAGVRTPLKEGDQVTLGGWTRITVRSVQVAP
jgi:hypothetical protein